MRIGVVSDTHLPRFGRQLPAALDRGLREAGVELILHLGDMTSIEVPGWFESIAPFDGVAGNNDGEQVRRRFGRRKLLVLDGVRVGLAHGDEGREHSTLLRALGSFAAEAPDVVLFGHSHVPYLAQHGPTLALNPGSPTDKRRQPRYTWATLDLRDGHVTAAIHAYDKRD